MGKSFFLQLMIDGKEGFSYFYCVAGLNLVELLVPLSVLTSVCSLVVLYLSDVINYIFEQSFL